MNTIPSAMCAFGTYSSTAVAADVKVALAGEQEAPSAESGTSDSGTITVAADGPARGSMTTTGITGIHVHVAAACNNAQVIITLPKDGDTYTAPRGATLSHEPYASVRTRSLYAHPGASVGGELRRPLKP